MKANGSLPRLFLLIPALALLLAACQQHESPTKPAIVMLQEPPTVAAAPEADTFEPAPEPAPEATAAPVAEVVEAVPEPVHLDLSIPEDILEEAADTGFPVIERALLPDMFAKKEEVGTQVSSRLHFEEGERVSVDTVSGAEITVKVPIN
jgi:hypothetical protein